MTATAPPPRSCATSSAARFQNEEAAMNNEIEQFHLDDQIDSLQSLLTKIERSSVPSGFMFSLNETRLVCYVIEEVELPQISISLSLL